MLSSPQSSFAPLLEPLFTPKTIPNTLLIILLDWEHPWTWLRDLRGWLRILRSVLSKLDQACQDALEENTKEWSERRRGPAAETSAPAGAADVASPAPAAAGDVTLPLGAGEYDEPLGLPLCVVAQGAEKIELFEKEHGWRDDEFDTVLQYLRTVLLKHGASLIYTPTSPSSASAATVQASTGSGGSAPPSSQAATLQALIRGSLGINSLLQKNALRHNLIDRDRILVPPNWDSWGKIRVLREGFDVEGTSDAWGFDIQLPRKKPSSDAAESTDTSEAPIVAGGDATEQDPNSPSAVTSYESAVQDPSPKRQPSAANEPLEVSCPPNQEFFSEQSRILERLKVDDAAEERKQEAKRTGGSSTGTSTPALSIGTGGRVSEHIGPVQFNMGGIQVDADDALKSLRLANGPATPSGLRSPRAEEATDTSILSTANGGEDETKEKSDGLLDETANNEQLKSFFAGLISRGAGANSPRSTS